MGWTIYGDSFDSGELSNTNKFATIVFDDSYYIKAIRTWIIVYNDPTFTSLNMKIYSNDDSSGDNTPKKILDTSTNSLTKSEIITASNGAKEIYFEFNNFPVRSGDKYNFVINGVGYAPAVDSHLAWRKATPNPVYTVNTYTPTQININIAPYDLYCVGVKV